jgi:acyl-lipid (7-3)-desaturase (Delta-4 desaturase)
MAPDGEKVRQRRVTSSKIQSSTFIDANDDPSVSAAATAATTITTQPPPKSIPLSQLKTNEMCIDGIIYNIEEFSTKHPGGNTFLTFGGNDVTTQYKMIHPYHTSKHLLKMGPPVGIAQDYHSELRMNIFVWHWMRVRLSDDFCTLRARLCGPLSFIFF